MAGAVLGLVTASTSCDGTYTGPFRDPNAASIPSFADSAFGSTTKWFKPRTFESITAAGLDAQSVYSVEFSAATGSTFVSVSAANGATRWTKSIPAGTDVVSVGGTAAAISAVVSAFDATTGAALFTYQPLTARLVTSNGATDGTRIIVGNANGEVVSLNATTGAEVWKTQVDTRTDSMPVKGVSVSGGIVFAGGDGFLAALDATTGALKWKQKTTDSPRPFVVGAPGVDGGRVTVMTFASSTYGLANYDANTGLLKWSQSGAGATASAELKSLPACDGNVITEDGSPGLAALTTAAGTTVWGRSLSVYSSLTASCANGTVITNGLSGAAGSLRNDVQVLRSTDGVLLIQYPRIASQQLRVYRVLRNATTLYFLTDRGVTSVPAP
jgi:outer membrane protein assembly factor BamB